MAANTDNIYENGYFSYFFVSQAFFYWRLEDLIQDNTATQKRVNLSCGI